MSQPLLFPSNAPKSANTSGVTIRKFYPSFTIAAGTSVTGMPFWTVPTDVTAAHVTNVYLVTGSTAPSSGTATVEIKKNGSTSVFTTAPTVTTTAVTNTTVNATSGATTGYGIPVMAAAVNLIAGDSLTYAISGGSTLTLQNVVVEVQDDSGTP